MLINVLHSCNIRSSSLSMGAIFFCFKGTAQTLFQVFEKLKVRIQGKGMESYVPLAIPNYDWNFLIYIFFIVNFQSSSHRLLGTLLPFCYSHFFFLLKKQFMWILLKKSLSRSWDKHSKENNEK